MGSEEAIFFILVRPLNDLERIATSNTFLLLTEIAVTTLSVNEFPRFLVV